MSEIQTTIPAYNNALSYQLITSYKHIIFLQKCFFSYNVVNIYVKT